jgi:ParB-like chromosome segregation protein Spo0J
VSSKDTTPEYTSHPITAVFPRMTPTAYAELKADIAANGQQVPIVILKNQILDGRHRYQACRELGVTPKVIDATGDPFLLVQSLNLRRRHLTADQIAAFHKTIEREHPALQTKLKAIEDAARERQLGALKQGETRSRRSQGKPTVRPGRTREVVAAAIGSTPTAVARVAQVEREAPEALPAIVAGEVTAKQVLHHGGAEKAKAAKAAGQRAAKQQERTKARRPEQNWRAYQDAIDQIVYWWKSGADATYLHKEFGAVLDRLLWRQWELASSPEDKQSIVRILEVRVGEARRWLERDDKAAATAATPATATKATAKAAAPTGTPGGDPIADVTGFFSQLLAPSTPKPEATS